MAEYTEENVRILDSKQIRLRPGMFVGRMDIRGFAELLKSFTPYLFDDLNSNHFQLILEDQLRGQITFSNLNGEISNQIGETWIPGFYDTNVSLILNALSLKFESSFFLNDELIHSKSYEKGELIKGASSDEMIIMDKWIINFELDKEMWFDLKEWNYHFITESLKNHAFLNKGKSFTIRYPTKTVPCHIHYLFENGLKDQMDLMKLNGIGNSFFDNYIEKEFEGFSMDIAFAFRSYNVDQPFIKSFANYHHTTEEGTHVEAVLKGLTYGVMKYFQKQGFTNEYKISQKGIRENLIAFIHIKMEAPTFSGCVKNRLSNPEVIQPIQEWISEVMFQMIENNDEYTELLIRKFEV